MHQYETCSFEYRSVGDTHTPNLHQAEVVKDISVRHYKPESIPVSCEVETV
jgi:hypothetical protein